MVSGHDIEKLTRNQNGDVVHYYVFFQRLAEILKPNLCLELGTWHGYSSAALASGHPDGKIITVDVVDQVIKEFRRDNIEYRIHDSMQLIPDLGLVDILFIDTLHDGLKPLYEFEVYKDYVKPGGLVFFDDTNLNPEMRDFWEDFNPEGYEKIDLPVHFDSGFGCLIKKMA